MRVPEYVNRTQSITMTEFSHTAVQQVFSIFSEIALSASYKETWIESKLTQASALLDQLPNTTCYPATRRCFAATIARISSKLQPFPDQLLKLACDIAEKLTLLHEHGARSKRLMEFLHISKSGGTSFCQVAKSNGCSTKDFSVGGNCLIKDFDDYPRWVSIVSHLRYHVQGNKLPWFLRHEDWRKQVPCHVRQKYLLTHRFNFYSNEYTLHHGYDKDSADQPLCEEFLNVFLFRDPVDRLDSHLRWIVKLYRQFYRESYTRYFNTSSSHFWELLAPAVMNNYNIRSLLGEYVYHLPWNSTNTDHLRRAFMVLLQYDVLLSLEEETLNELSTAVGLGWQVPLGSKHARVGVDPEKQQLQGLPNDAVFKELEEHNRLDSQLYQMHVALHALDAFVFQTHPSLKSKPEAGSDGQQVCGYLQIQNDAVA